MPTLLSLAFVSNSRYFHLEGGLLLLLNMFHELEDVLDDYGATVNEHLLQFHFFVDL